MVILEELKNHNVTFEPGDVTVIGGCRAMGKTTFALNLVFDIAMNDQKHRVERKIFYYSAEDTVEYLSDRFHTMKEAREDGYMLPKGCEYLCACDYVTSESFDISSCIAEAISRMCKKNKGNIVIVDCCQSMDAQIDNVIFDVKKKAKRHGLHVILISQLSQKHINLRAGHLPIIEDLDRTDLMELYADQVLLLHRPEYYNKGDSPGLMNVLVAKNKGIYTIGPPESMKFKVQMNTGAIFKEKKIHHRW